MEQKTKFKDLSSKEKILKLARVGEVVAKLLYICAIVGAVTCAVLAIVLPLAGVTGDYQKAEVAILLGGAALYSFLSINVLWNVEQIFKSIRVNQTPFHTQVIHYLKKTAIAMIIIAIVPALIGSILIHVFATDSVVRFNFQYLTLVVGFVLLMLGYVFNYGIELQNKDDETL